MLFSARNKNAKPPTNFSRIINVLVLLFIAYALIRGFSHPGTPLNHKMEEVEQEWHKAVPENPVQELSKELLHSKRHAGSRDATEKPLPPPPIR